MDGAERTEPQFSVWTVKFEFHIISRAVKYYFSFFSSRVQCKDRA